MLGQVVILGDFNSHLGYIGGAGDPNIALHDVMDRCDLSHLEVWPQDQALMGAHKQLWIMH